MFFLQGCDKILQALKLIYIEYSPPTAGPPDGGGNTEFVFFNIMPFMIAVLIAGFGGGVIRGLVGFVKHQYSYKNVEFDLPYFLTMMLISGIIGLLSSLAVERLGLGFFGLPYITPAMAFVIGYAGGDFLENLAKTALKKPDIWELQDFWTDK